MYKNLGVLIPKKNWNQPGFPLYLFVKNKKDVAAILNARNLFYSISLSLKTASC